MSWTYNIVHLLGRIIGPPAAFGSAVTGARFVLYTEDHVRERILPRRHEIVTFDTLALKVLRDVKAGELALVVGALIYHPDNDGHLRAQVKANLIRHWPLAPGASALLESEADPVAD